MFCFCLAFRATSSFRRSEWCFTSFGVQSHIFARCSEPHLHSVFRATTSLISTFSALFCFILAFQATTYLRLAFRVVFYFIWCSEPHLHSTFRAASSFGVQSHYVTHFSIQHLVLFHFGVQSHYLSLFGVQSRVLLHLVFRATSSLDVQSRIFIRCLEPLRHSIRHSTSCFVSFWHLEPLLIFVRHSESCFISFGVQSHIFAWRLEPHLHSVFRATTSLISTFSALFCFILAFRDTTYLHSAFRATT